MDNEEKYIIIGKYNFERNSWLENGDIRHFISAHCTAEEAESAVYEAEMDLGNVDGGNSLTQIMIQLPKEAEADFKYDEDYYEYHDRIYVDLFNLIFGSPTR